MKKCCPTCGAVIEPEFVKIGYKQISKKLFEKYGLKPFRIMKLKMRRPDGSVWNNINYFDAIKECEKLGGELPDIQTWFLLLEAWKESKQPDKGEFLGIEELGNLDVFCEWVFVRSDVAGLRSGGWVFGADAGRFALYLSAAPSNADDIVGFRCALRGV